MNERIKPDYSARINLHGSEEQFIVSPKYDHIQQFRWLGHAIIRYMSSEGIQHIHISSETGDRIVEHTGIPVAEMEFMLESDYLSYLEAQAGMLEEQFGAEFNDN